MPRAKTSTLRLASKRRVLFAVNEGVAPVDATIEGAELKAGEAKVLGENRVVKVEAGRLQDRFEPLAAHVYELP